MPVSPPERYSWNELARVPKKPGVYAWYLVPSLSQHDVDKTCAELKELKQAGDDATAVEVVRRALDALLYSYFREDPYQVSVAGQLKPTYLGQVIHEPKVSKTLAKRLCEDPDRLYEIREALQQAVPMFSSPIYIGKSDDLRTRIDRHRSLIEKLRARKTLTSLETADAGFAMQVVRRNIQLENLLVFVMGVSGTPDIEVDIEHILNRISYPILGRN